MAMNTATHLSAKSGTFITFKVAREGNTRTERKRSRYDPVRRQEVKAVRKRGACLRCRVLQIKCSCDDPCTTCMKLASTSATSVIFEKKVLRFSECIRTLLCDVSVFEHAIPAPEQFKILNQKTNAGSSAPLFLESADQVRWDLKSLVDDAMAWLNAPQASIISQVGTLSASRFLDLIKPYVEEKVILHFQRMIYSESVSHTEPPVLEKHRLRFEVQELQQIGAMAGHQCLKYLDQRLKPQSLALCSIDELRALFLFLVGTIIAVGYTRPTIAHPDFPSQNGSNERKTLYEVMQNHLCKTLAHFVVFIGSKLGLPIHGSAEQTLLDGAHVQWHKEAMFLWRPTYSRPFLSGRSLTLVSNWTTEIPREELSGYIWNMRAGPGSHVPETSNIQVKAIQEIPSNAELHTFCWECGGDDEIGCEWCYKRLVREQSWFEHYQLADYPNVWSVISRSQIGGPSNQTYTQANDPQQSASQFSGSDSASEGLGTNSANGGSLEASSSSAQHIDEEEWPDLLEWDTELDPRIGLWTGEPWHLPDTSTGSTWEALSFGLDK